jgi:hypothetical protein
VGKMMSVPSVPVFGAKPITWTEAKTHDVVKSRS